MLRRAPERAELTEDLFAVLRKSGEQAITCRGDVEDDLADAVGYRYQDGYHDLTYDVLWVVYPNEFFEDRVTFRLPQDNGEIPVIEAIKVDELDTRGGVAVCYSLCVLEIC